MWWWAIGGWFDFTLRYAAVAPFNSNILTAAPRALVDRGSIALGYMDPPKFRSEQEGGCRNFAAFLSSHTRSLSPAPTLAAPSFCVYLKDERTLLTSDEEGKCYNFAYLRPPQKPQYDLQIALVPGNSASHFSFVNPFCRSVLHPKWHCNPVSQPAIQFMSLPRLSSTKHSPYAHSPPHIPQTPTLVR